MYDITLTHTRPHDVQLLFCINHSDPITSSLQFTLQTDMSRRQLEFEARQIRSAMEEQLGSCQEMERRAQVRSGVKVKLDWVDSTGRVSETFVCVCVCFQARVARIQQIEKDILRLGARLQVSSPVKLTHYNKSDTEYYLLESCYVEKKGIIP